MSDPRSPFRCSPHPEPGSSLQAQTEIQAHFQTPAWALTSECECLPYFWRWQGSARETGARDLGCWAGTFTPGLWPLYHVDIWLLPHSTPALHSLGPRLSWPYVEPPTLRNLYKRKVNQLVSIFSATDSVLREEQQMGEWSHFYYPAGTGPHDSHSDHTHRPGFCHCTSATAVWGGSCFPGSSQ